jgi:arylsulfatase A-like enzyme
VLSANGYATAGVVSHAAVGSRRGFDQGYDIYLESEAQGHDHVSTPGVTRQAVERMEMLAAGDRPFFLFVHYFDPHYNYKRHPEYGFAPDSAGRLSGAERMQELRRMATEMTPQEVDLLRALYDEEIRFTDAGIGRLLERLDELGLRDETLIVFTADHGEGFLAHGHLGHTSTLYEELVRVPLILRPPGLAAAGRVVRRPVSVVALTPTILDLVGVDASDLALQAGSLTPWLGGAGDGEPVEIYCEVDFVPVRATRLVPETHKQALIGKRYKLIRDAASGRLELYDLRGDAEETHDLAERRPTLTAELAEGLERWLAQAATEALDAAGIRLDEAEIERLEALGYVGED